VIGITTGYGLDSDSEDGGGMPLRKAGEFLPDNMALYKMAFLIVTTVRTSIPRINIFILKIIHSFSMQRPCQGFSINGNMS
jgi:hypothetical protein